jgi:hypothetical protein
MSVSNWDIWIWKYCPLKGDEQAAGARPLACLYTFEGSFWQLGAYATCDEPSCPNLCFCCSINGLYDALAVTS